MDVALGNAILEMGVDAAKDEFLVSIVASLFEEVV